ncbi:unnamed protein product [Prorocentrum cordatum]|uniref:Uncharacterized protein n=1 Tax=Prorocentrum cordatum TaxID=2364126 RepID=A0ABN9Q4T1_9DINO|nr:unnamed protein product [Polarella glacialis]
MQGLQTLLVLALLPAALGGAQAAARAGGAIGQLEMQMHAMEVEQDPCAGCDEGLAYSYQACARDHGNPCAERNEAGLVTGAQGTKKDVSCCLTKEKHDRCLECKSMDCAYKTCNVNKQYYAERTLVEAENTRDKQWDSKAMEAAGWGTDNTD